MTKAALYKIYDLKVEIRDTENYLACLDDKINNPVPKNDGMPRSSNIRDKVGNLTARKIDAENRLQKLQKGLRATSIELAAEICRLPIEEVKRQILLLQYFETLREILDEEKENGGTT